MVVVLVGLARAAHADVIDRTITANDLAAAVPGLIEQRDEPVGLLALQDNPALGLVKGDLVRAINGQSATRMTMLSSGGAIFYLDVVRGAQAIVVRIAVKLDAAEATISRDRYRDRVQQFERFRDLVTNKSHTFTQVTAGGMPSGVMVPSSWFGFGTLIEGDVIRKIDGVNVSTIEQAVAAFGRDKDSVEVQITVERLGQTVVKTLRIDDSLNPDLAVAAADDDADGDEPPPIPARKPQIAMSLTDPPARHNQSKTISRHPESALAIELGRSLGSR